MQPEDPTLAEFLKPHGYVTGQFGKNHLGDFDEHLPTAHGFDEFFGSLYHLNASDEPEHPDYPKAPEFRKRFGPRGVLHTFADGRIEDTGPLTKKRMETIDQEVTNKAIDFLKRAKSNSRTSRSSSGGTRRGCTSGNLPQGRKPGSKPVSASIPTAWSSMTRWSARCSRPWKYSALLKTPWSCTRPTTAPRNSPGRTAGQSPFRGEKNTNWEGGYRVPCAVRWPGVIKPGTIYNEIVAHEDWIPTLVAAAGDPDIKEKLLTGHKVGDKAFKVHLDGYNVTDYLAGTGGGSAQGFYLFRR